MIARCLVADDHPALLHAVVSALGELGYEVVATAADGLHAVELATAERPELAVVDFRMPRLAGIELIEQLSVAVPEMAIAVYTAEADEALVRGSLAAGARAVLLKESPLPDLGRALRSLLDGAQFVDPALASFAVGLEDDRPLLTEREQAVLTLLAQGMTHEEIGRQLSISAETVRTHVRKACGRLGAATRTHAVARALRLGLIT